jgi:hypothetical protein
MKSPSRSMPTGDHVADRWFRRLAPAPREAATGHLRCPYGAGHTGTWREGVPGRAAYLDGLTAGGEGRVERAVTIYRTFGPRG